MKKLFLVVLLTFSLLASVRAGIRVEVPSIDSLPVGSWEMNDFLSIIIDTLSITADAISSDFITTSIWTAPAEKTDTSTHYIEGLDTVITRHRIECDTTTIEKLIIGDTAVIRLGVECDTIYRVEYRPVWKPKIKVFLEPDQLKQLIWLIKHSDEIEMKKTYGQKE